MARPRKDPEDLRRNNLKLRFTDAEYRDLKQRALVAGVTPSEYARETILGRRPKARSTDRQILDRALYELQSIATNFTQLASATGDQSFDDWARYVGGDLIERIVDRPEILPVLEGGLESLNEAGQFINQLAHQANAGKPLEEGQIGDAIEAIREATAPLHEAIELTRFDEGRGR